MKIQLIEGVMTAQAETHEDVMVLLKLKGDSKTTGAKRGKYKKQVRTRKCDLCEKEFKGRRGLGIHKWKIHQINSPKTIERQVTYMKKASEGEVSPIRMNRLIEA